MHLGHAACLLCNNPTAGTDLLRHDCQRPDAHATWCWFAQDSRLLLELPQPLLAVGRAKVGMHTQQFLELLQQAAALQDAQERAAGHLTDQYYQLLAQQVKLQVRVLQ